MTLKSIVVIALMLSCVPSAQAEQPLHVSVASGMSKIRPTEPPPADAQENGAVSLMVARGECEAAQLAVTASSEPEKDVRASASSLRAGTKELPVQLYREAFLDLKTPSDGEGATGLWPDPLIPVVDEIAHEARNAFPVDIPRGHHQPIYIEVCAPHDTAPGDYSGEITVTAHGRAAAHVSVRVAVQRISIPATSSIPVTFGLSTKSLEAAHGGADGMQLLPRYATDALRHRISLHAMSMQPPHLSGFGSDLHVDFREWDAEIGPFMDGLAGLDGAKFSAVDLRTPKSLSGSDLTTYYRDVVAHFREKGWLDRLFAYVMDEPKPARYPELIQRLQALNQMGIRRLVTVPLDKDLLGLVDIWTPNLNCLAFKAKPDEFCHRWASRASYDDRIKLGEQLWWYQSCSSHGCGNHPTGARSDPYFSGWPSYMIDIDGAAARVMGWLAFSQHIGGELYFDTVYAYNTSDPWESVWAFGGNGDGTLFYPGTPERIGGKTDIPVESLRLKQIRDGLEDYELLHLLASSGPEGARQAQAIASRIAPRLFQYERSPDAFRKARQEIFQALELTVR